LADELYLIDTMGYIFRAFHALPPLSNAAGVPTQAVLGLVNMLRKLQAEAQPGSIVAAYDLAGPTFRDTAFAGYKANREAMPDTLVPQLPYIRRALEALSIPILEATGFEADDVIGTVARQALAAGLAVVVVSSDKDLLQLVGPGVRVFNPSRNQWFDAAAVEAKLGVRPDQVADLLALRGDAIDNIPGAPGIGEVGARKIIQRFGSVEAALERAAEIEHKTYRESLQNFAEQVRLSKSLATIHCEAPVTYDPEAWKTRAPDLAACQALFAELEFHHLLREFGGGPAERIAAELVTAGVEELERFLGEPGPIAMLVNVEAGVNAGAIELARPTGARLLVESESLAPLRAALADPARHWQWNDSKEIGARLQRLGLSRPALAADTIDDVGLLAYLDDPTRPAQALADSGAIAVAAPGLRARIEASGQFSVYRDLDLALVEVIETMEESGVRLDPAPLAALSIELERRCLECQEQVFTLAGTSFNLNSPQQLAEVLFTKMGLPAPAPRGKSKGLSTAMDVLEDLAADHAVVRPVLEYRQLSKLKSTYVDALPPLLRPSTGRLHTTFTIAGSATGRLASSNPNLQNIPIRTELGREIRAAFVPDPGYVLLAADYSQIELRLLAHFSQDPLLLDAYRTGGDIHRLTAAEVFGVPPLMIEDEHRRRAKAVNFGIVYGLSAFGLARQLGIPQAEAARFIKRYFERYAGVKQYIAQGLEAARKTGRVTTLLGRVRPIPNLDARNPTLRGFAERTAINTPLQGTAADLIKLAMIRLHPRLRDFGARMLLQVHDELVFEVPKGRAEELEAVVREVMEGVAELSVPLEIAVGIGPNWRDL